MPKIPRFHAVENYLRILKMQKCFSQNTRFRADPKLWKMVNIFFKNMFDLIGFTYVLKILEISKIYQDSTIVFCFENARRSQSFWTYQIWGKTLKINSTCLMPGSVKQMEILDFRNVEIWKIILFEEVSISVLIFRSILVYLNP